MTDDDRLDELLQPVPDIHARLLWLGGAGPAPGCAALGDAGEPLGSLVRSAAVTASTNGVDHLVAWAGLRLRGRLAPAFAHYTLLRATFEGVCTSRWLADAKVEPRVRIARAIGAQLADLAERRKIEQMARPAGAAPLERGPDYRPASERIARLEEAAAVAGLCPVRISHTDVVDRFGPGEASYRILSAFAHGGQAVPLAASRSTINADQDADGLTGVRLEADPAATIRMSEIAVHTATVAVRELFSYHGRSWDDATPADAG
jgi:hypothetical protein